MKAALFKKYGDPEVLTIENIPRPEISDKEILVKVSYTTVTAADCLMRRSEEITARLVLGIRKPRKRYRILGIEFSGEVVSAGRSVSRFKKGDRVYGFTGFQAGAYAEFVRIKETASVSIIPEGTTFEEAVALADSATTALYFLKKLGRLVKDQKVLIIGASGSVGSAAVQVASYLGAEVYGVCSTGNRNRVLSLGAVQVFDYTSEDYTDAGISFDIVFDAVGKSSFSTAKKTLKPRGSYLVTNGNIPMNYLKTLWSRIKGGRKFLFGMSVNKIEELEILNEMIRQGKITPWIDRSYTLEEIAMAHRYVETGHKKGNVIIDVAGDNERRR